MPDSPLLTGLADVQRPRGGLVVNGTRMDDLLLEFGVQNNNYFSADTFQATLRLDDSDTQYGPAFWASQDTADVQILVGDGDATQQLISGRADDVELDYPRREIRLSGRDYTADLLEAVTTEKWPNRTASEIVKDIAGRHNLTPVVTATSTRSGTYYTRDHVRLTDESTEWNLVTYLAEQEGFVVYLSGKELHFESPPLDADATRWVLKYEPPTLARPYARANGGGLILRRNLTVARNVIVKVVSWNSKQKKSFEVTRRADKARRARGVSDLPSQTFVYRLPGLTEEQAIQEADRRLKAISQHERSVDWSGPGDVSLTPRQLLVVQGTGTEFDQPYFIDAVDRRLSDFEGFTMRIRARNRTPESRAAL
ncbi:Hypothetical protein RMP42_05985 [Roseomonas mucosa]|nr:Hypothetical protein RMP42_05985 [Roseomonas mucosa]